MTRPSEVVTAKIAVADLDRSYDFYTRVIGMRDVASEIMPPPVFGDPDVASTQAPLNFSGVFTDPFICLLKVRGVALPPEHAGAICVSLRVTDLDALLERAAAAGFPLTRDVIRMGALSVAFLTDPDGYTVEIAESSVWPPVAVAS